MVWWLVFDGRVGGPSFVIALQTAHDSSMTLTDRRHHHHWVINERQLRRFMTTSYGKDGIKWFLCVAYDVQADILALKQGSIIVGHCNNPAMLFCLVCGDGISSCSVLKYWLGNEKQGVLGCCNVQ